MKVYTIITMNKENRTGITTTPIFACDYSTNKIINIITIINMN